MLKWVSLALVVAFIPSTWATPHSVVEETLYHQFFTAVDISN